LHDVGRSGWWIVALLPTVAIGTWNEIQRLLHRFVYPPPRLPLPQLIDIGVGCLTLAVMVLLLWNDDPDANRYGPNPRYGPVGEPA